jgi:hypothetical protein
MIRESISLPYCQACLGHFREWQRSNNANLVAANIGIWGLAACFAGHLSAYLLPIGPVAAGGYLIYRKRVGQMPLKPTCATRGRACVVVWYRGPTYIYSFASEKYAEEFRKLNAEVVTKG